MKTHDKTEELNPRELASKALMKLGEYYTVVSTKFGQKGKIAFSIGAIAAIVGIFNLAFSAFGWIASMLAVPAIIGALGFVGWKYGAPHVKSMMEDK